MNRIFKKAEGKSCSCPTGKKCAACKNPRAIKPVVYIEEPRRLPTSIVIARLTRKQNELNKIGANKAKEINKLHTEGKKKVEKLNKLCSEEEKRVLKLRKSDEKLKKEQQPQATKKRLQGLRSWYRQRKDLIRLAHDRRKEKKEKEKVNENEALHAHDATVEGKKEQAKAGGEKEQRKVKENEATAKPIAYSKYASANHASKTNKTLTYRFVNFCNKLCCQCYCYFSIIFMLGLLFIYFV